MCFSVAVLTKAGKVLVARQFVEVGARRPQGVPCARGRSVLLDPARLPHRRFPPSLPSLVVPPAATAAAAAAAPPSKQWIEAVAAGRRGATSFHLQREDCPLLRVWLPAVPCR